MTGIPRESHSPDRNSRKGSKKTLMIIVAIFSFLIIVTLLTAGCGGWNGARIQRDQDIRITKLDSDGMMEWTTLLDTGNYDFGLDFIQTPDGGFAIVGGTTRLRCQNFPQAPETPQLTRLSATGETLWARDYTFHIAGVIPNRDGNLSAVSDSGKILPLDSNGSVVHEFNPGVNGKPAGIWDYDSSFTGLIDGNYVFPGLIVVSVNNSENLTWGRINESSINKIFSIADLSDTSGYLLIVNDINGTEFLRTDTDGNVLGRESVRLFSETPKPVIYRTSEGFSVIVDEFGSFKAFQFDRNGIKKGNITISKGDTVIPSDDGGFVSISRADPGDQIARIKYTSGGTVSSVKTMKCSSKGCPVLYGDIIHTSDGGYALMSLIRKEKEC